ncbi:MAG: phosphatase [Sphaerochaetaceae bacterium]
MNNNLQKKYQIIGDFHTHTMVSQHAYSTIAEMIASSQEQGFSAIAITDHGPEMMDGAISHHFFCMSGLPSLIGDFHLYKGAEVNIKDFNGRIDLPKQVLELLDFVIASYHVEAITPGTKTENTEGWLSVIENQYVDCLGHVGNPVFPFEHEKVVKALARKGKILEINANSFLVRPGSEENCRDVISLCKKYEVPVTVNSDAHSKWQVGKVDAALHLLEEMKFPPQMILNSNLVNIKKYIETRKQEKKEILQKY